MFYKVKLILLIVLLAQPIVSQATDQTPDFLNFGNLSLHLQTGWGHPSPLQTYFHQNKIAYPFRALSTDNYRGHVATWTIANGKMYLQRVTVSDKRGEQHFFKVDIQSTDSDSATMIFAGWFSGVIECLQYEGTGVFDIGVVGRHYFQVERGLVLSRAFVSNDLRRKLNESLMDSSSEVAHARLHINLYDRYVAYYYRLTNSDSVNYAGRKFLLTKSYWHLSPVMSFYNDDHLKWRYNWKNEYSGAANCTWTLVGDSLHLSTMKLHRGLSFDSIDVRPIQLSSLFPGHSDETKVFAYWATGIYRLVSGYYPVNDSLKEFQATSYIFLRTENGVVKEKYEIEPGALSKKHRREINADAERLVAAYFAY